MAARSCLASVCRLGHADRSGAGWLRARPSPTSTAHRLLSTDASTPARAELYAQWHAAARRPSAQQESRDSLSSSCAVLHQDGTREMVHSLNKRELLEQFGLHARDLRLIDAKLVDVRPSLIVGDKSIVICTPVVRALISFDRLVCLSEEPFVSEAEGSELIQSVEQLLKDGVVGCSGEPFELRVLEALLLITLRGHRAVALQLQERVDALLSLLRQSVDRSALRDLLEVKRAVNECLLTGRALQSALSAVLGEDEDLVSLYLTDKRTGRSRPTDEHQSAELLLEHYERRLDETNERMVRLDGLLTDIESNITLVLAATRVRLQNLELQTAIGSLAAGSGMVIASLFGQNLISGYESSPTAFYVATSGALCVMGATLCIGYARLAFSKRTQLIMRVGSRK